MYKEQEATLEEMKKTKKELEELKGEIDAEIQELRNSAKESMVSLSVGAVVSGCAYNVVEKIASLFLPKNLRGVAKVGAMAGTLFIPELIGNLAANKVESILKEE